MTEYSKSVFGTIAFVGVWVFLIWLGLNAIDRADTYLLGMYVIAGATGVSALLAKIWS